MQLIGLKTINPSITLISWLEECRMEKIKIDTNNPQFQQDFFHLEKPEQLALIRTLKKISEMQWPQLYSDKGLKWEAILSKETKSGQRIDKIGRASCRERV